MRLKKENLVSDDGFLCTDYYAGFSFSVILDFAKQLVPSLSVTSADIALSSYANKMDIERNLVDEIKKIDGVANAYGSSYVENIPATSSRAGIDHINIVSYDDTLLDYSKGSIAQGSLDTVYGNSNKVATVFNRNNPLHIGDTIQFAGEEVEITCALSQGLFGDDLIIICSQETFDRIMGGTKYGLIGIQLDSNATEETIAEIRSLETMILSLQISVKAINKITLHIGLHELFVMAS